MVVMMMTMMSVIVFVTSVLTEKFFDMSQKQCKDALEIYKKFIARMDRVRVFLKVAEVRRRNIALLELCVVNHS